MAEDDSDSVAQAHRMLKEWCHGVHISHRAHDQAATSYEKRGRCVAVGSLVLSTVVGTAIFSSVSTSPAVGWKVLAGLLSVAAAVLSALQAFLGYPELAERHRQAALAHGRLRHHLEVVLSGQSPLTEVLESISSEWDNLRLETPTVPERIYRRAESEIMMNQSDT